MGLRATKADQRAQQEAERIRTRNLGMGWRHDEIAAMIQTEKQLRGDADELRVALAAALEQNKRFAAEISLLRGNRDLAGEFIRAAEEMLFRSSEGRLLRVVRPKDG